MRWFVDIGLVTLLAIVAFQDLKQRQISWVLLPLLLSLFLVRGSFLNSANELIHFALFNAGFIVVQLLVLTAYMSIKNKEFSNIINSYLGLGDILFFIVICVAFSPVNFIVFYITGLLLTLLVFVAYNLLRKKNEKEIPLAGAMAVLMISLILLSRWSIKFNFYNDDFLTGWFINK